MTITTSIYKALFEHLETLTTTPETDVAHFDADHNPTDGKSYLEVNIFPQEPLTHLHGSADKKVYRGTLQITVVSKTGRGLLPETALADQIIEHFKMGTTVTEAGVQVEIEKQPGAATSFIRKNKVHTPVRIRYFSTN